MNRLWLLIALLGLLACQTAAPTAKFVPIEAVNEEEPTATAVVEPPTPTAVPPTLPPPASPTEMPTAVPPTPPAPTVEPSPAPQTAVPATSIQWEAIASGFDTPVGLAHAGDERLFIVEQPGRIRLIQDGQVLATPFLDIANIVNDSANEQGLLGLAFHPEYGSNGRFYVNYSGDNGETIIAEYGVSNDPNTADSTSGRILLTIPQPYGNHNGGQLAFGPDGYLYIGMGDGGSQNDPQNNAQNGASLLGKILRLDVNQEPYAIPTDNPFVGQSGVRGEIWAFGLRNPWRFSFDKLTGDLFIADVGQNEWEEISWQPAGLGGQNYGWRIYEGSQCYLDDCNTPNLTAPIAEYSHSGGHCSVTGGYMYRGTAVPALWGNYFLADYCSGAIWRLFPNPSTGAWDLAEVGRANFRIASFGEDVYGELYILSQNEGVVYRVRQ